MHEIHGALTKVFTLREDNTDTDDALDEEVQDVIDKVYKSIQLRKNRENFQRIMIGGEEIVFYGSRWNEEDEQKQTDIFEEDDSSASMSEYHNDLYLALRSYRQSCDEDSMQSSVDFLDESDNKAQRMQSFETQESIQKELDSLPAFARSTASHLNLFKRTNDVGLHNDTRSADLSECISAVEYLHQREVELVKYKKTLRESLAVVKHTDECNDAVGYIQDELANIASELRDIFVEVNQLNVHNNNINDAMMRDIRKASSALDDTWTMASTSQSRLGVHTSHDECDGNHCEDSKSEMMMDAKLCALLVLSLACLFTTSSVSFSR